MKHWKFGIVIACAIALCGCNRSPYLETEALVTMPPYEVPSTEEPESPQESSTGEEIVETTEVTQESTEGITLDVTLPYETKETITEAPTVSPTLENGDVIGVDSFFLYQYPVEYRDEMFNFRVSFEMPQLHGIADEALFHHINTEVMVPYAQNNFEIIYVLEDIDITYTFETASNHEKFVSFLFNGVVKHLDTNGSQYREEDITKHCFTMERLTGHIYNIEEAYGMERVYKDIAKGNYQVVEGEASVFEAFSNEQLAALYRDFNTVSHDENHEKDFFIRDGKLSVLIWVGNAYGNYVILELGGIPLI